jgi:hypothetical protein
MTENTEPGVAVIAEQAPPPGVPAGFAKAAIRGKIFKLLAFLCVGGAAATAPFAAYLSIARGSAPVHQHDVLRQIPAALAGLLCNLPLLLAFAYLGLYAAERVGLTDPILRSWATGPVDRRRLRGALLGGCGLGLAAAVVTPGILWLHTWLLGSRLPPERVDVLGRLPAWTWIPASVGAGLLEETLFRLGLLTLGVWAGTRLLRARPHGGLLLWSVNVGVALLFALSHLPMVRLAFAHVNAAALAVGLDTRFGVGLLLGWTYWRYGLVAAMVCHAAYDIVLVLLSL